jgi:hypothetical protein
VPVKLTCAKMVQNISVGINASTKHLNAFTKVDLNIGSTYHRLLTMASHSTSKYQYWGRLHFLVKLSLRTYSGFLLGPLQRRNFQRKCIPLSHIHYMQDTELCLPANMFVHSWWCVRWQTLLRFARYRKPCHNTTVQMNYK